MGEILDKIDKILAEKLKSKSAKKNGSMYYLLAIYRRPENIEADNIYKDEYGDFWFRPTVRLIRYQTQKLGKAFNIDIEYPEDDKLGEIFKGYYRQLVAKKLLQREKVGGKNYYKLPKEEKKDILDKYIGNPKDCPVKLRLEYCMQYADRVFKTTGFKIPEEHIVMGEFFFGLD
jgi:hypothetical protein